MIFEFVLTAVGIGVMATLINGIEDHKKDTTTNFSFKESMDLTSLPVITFYNNGKKLNLLLDTGANNSVLNARELEGCLYTKMDAVGTLSGLEGVKRRVEYVKMELSYLKDVFEANFQVTDMNQAFDGIKQESGVMIHGILGTAFFEKYKYIIDFEKFIAYSNV